MTGIPWDKEESLKLEFKSWAGLEDLSAIARVVVGMLNAEGGEIWIGIEETPDGRLLAGRPDAPRHLRRLDDFLAGAVEPAPAPGEVDIDLVPLPTNAGKSLLCVRVGASRQSGRRPFALLQRGSRAFVLRVDGRLRPMTREEIFSAASPRPPATPPLYLENLKAWRDHLLTDGKNGLWLAIEPERAAEVDLGAAENLLMDPAATGNRRAGWTYVNPYIRPTLRQDGLIQEDPDGSRLKLGHNGSIRFFLPLERLHWKGPERSLWPFALMEFPTSVLRLAGKVLGQARGEGHVAIDCAILGLVGWCLRPGSPGTFHRKEDVGRLAEGQRDFLLEPLMVLPVSELVASPDKCAYQIITRIYADFGLSDERIPEFYDHERGILVLPE